MSTSDWVVLVGLVPLILATGIWSSVRIWIRQEDVSASVQWAVGRSGRSGFEAAQLPLTVGMTLGWLALLTAPVWEKPHTPSHFSIVAFVLGLLALWLGFWLWLFMWPKFLVPPHLRTHKGLIVAAVIARKQARSARLASRRRGGGPAHARVADASEHARKPD